MEKLFLKAFLSQTKEKMFKVANMAVDKEYIYIFLRKQKTSGIFDQFSALAFFRHLFNPTQGKI